MYRSACVAMIVLAALLLMAVPFAHAQDAGTPDTLRLTSGNWTVDSNADSLFTVEMWSWIDDPQIRACSFGFRLNTSADAGYGPHVDSFIVVDTFVFDPGMTAAVKTYTRSLYDESIDPDAADWGYNGFSIGLVDFVATILPVETSVKIGDLTLKIIDRERLPEEFTIEVDSSFFPPAGVFKFSPQGGDGFAPVFLKSVIEVTNDLTPEIIDVTPNAAKQSDTLTVEVTGSLTHFSEGETSVYITNGTTTLNGYNVSVSSPTSLEFDLAIAEDEETGPYDLMIEVVGFPTVTEADGFTINPPFLCGDANGTYKVDISDIVYILNYIFKFGPAPIPYEAGDANCDGQVDIDDVIYLLGYIFWGGYAPCDPDGDNIPDC